MGIKATKKARVVVDMSLKRDISLLKLSHGAKTECDMLRTIVNAFKRKGR